MTGTTFGRGIYFYDIFSRAFCNCKAKNDIALILLCKIKMDNPYELNHKKPIVEKEFENEDFKFNKCVKGIGTNYCEELKSEEINLLLKNQLSDIELDNFSASIGKISDKEKQETFLPFNEYVVYDSNDVEICYVMMVKCNTLELKL